MPRSLKSKNPFYALLVIAGVMFAITATAYCMMAFRESHASAIANGHNAPAAAHPLIAWMSRNGETTLMTELAFLAVFTIGAISTDEYWQRRTTIRR